MDTPTENAKEIGKKFSNEDLFAKLNSYLNYGSNQISLLHFEYRQYIPSISFESFKKDNKPLKLNFEHDSQDVVFDEVVGLLLEIWSSSEIYTSENEFSALSLNVESLDIFEKFLKVASQPERLVHLNLEFGESLVDDEVALKIADFFERCKSATRVVLDTPFCNKLSDKGAVALFQAVSKLPKLKKLVFNFHQSDEMTDVSLKQFSDCMIPLESTLEDLEFHVFMCKQFTDKGYQDLAPGFKLLKNLRRVHLAIGYNETATPKTFFSLFSAFHEYKNLEALNLEFEGSSNITNETALKVGKIINNNEKLTSIKLNFNMTELADGGINEICKAVTARKDQLQTFSLLLYNAEKITKQSFAYLANCVGQLENLSYLGLNFSGCSFVSDEEFNLLNKALKSNTKVSYFRFQLGKTLVTDDAFDNFLDSLLGWSQLNWILLDFESCKYLTGESLCYIAAFLKRMKSITYLYWMFDRWSKIGDLELNVLANAVKKSPQLRYLSFHIDITRNGFRRICEAITSVPELTELEISGFSSKEVDDSDITLLGKSLKSMKKLTTFMFSFFEWSKVGDSGVYELGEGITSIPGLTRLFLHISGAKCTDQAKQNMDHIQSKYRQFI